MTTKSFLSWLWRAMIDLVVDLAAKFLMCWWLPLFANKDGWLPRWLFWFQTFDASLDWGWQGGTFPPSLSQHWDRTKWLFRNSAYGFSYFVMGIPMDVTKWHVHKCVNSERKQLFIATDEAGHFNFYYHGPFGMYKFGWKAWNYWDIDKMDWKPRYQWGPLLRTSIVCSANPFKRRAA